MRALLTVLIILTTTLVLIPLAGCPTNPDAEKKVQEAVKVPGLDQAILAKDKAIKATLELSYAADVELIQEQIKVKEVKAGLVTLTGVVSRQDLKERAESIAREMEGVSDIVSTIEVDETLQGNRIDFDF